MYPETFFKVNRLSSSQFLFVSFLNLMIYLFCCARKVLIDWLVYINFKNEIPWYDIWSEGSLSIFWYCPWLCYYFKGIKTLLVHKRTKSTCILKVPLLYIFIDKAVQVIFNQDVINDIQGRYFGNALCHSICIHVILWFSLFWSALTISFYLTCYFFIW